ncbi:hypothetical protein GCM10009557_36650 [Virgisporangium ochraceum]
MRTCPRTLPRGLEYVAGWSVWSVAFADGTTASIGTRTFPGFEEPRYPDGAAVPAGQCARGWITLPVPKGKRPTMVLYRPVGDVHAWTVPPPS